uniref:HTH tetR-type domain-containing protein n=1 Tax=OCS116 cluster bacterium TaxID=2030921 RepID=A0A2A4Z5G7_9PROT
MLSLPMENTQKVANTRSEHRANTKTSRLEWLAEAKKLLIEGGIEQVKIDRIAKNLGVSRGGFYWFFKSRQDILETLLADWLKIENDPLINALNGHNDTPLDPFFRFFTRLLRERTYSPKLDTAMREWARQNKAAADAVTHVDNRRIEALKQAFLGLNYQPADAFIRARILYYHQIGYYAMNVIETEAQRQQYLPTYFKQLTGFDLPNEILDELYKK